MSQSGAGSLYPRNDIEVWGSSVSARLTETRPIAWRLVLVLVAAAVALALLPASGHAATDPCATPVTNPVACENSKPGNPQSDWDVTGVGDKSIQGFATKMSVNVGQSISFKVDAVGRLPHRHLPPRLLRRRWRPARSLEHLRQRRTINRPASPSRRQASSTVATGASRRPGRSRAPRSRASTSPCSSATTPAATARSRSSYATTRATPTSSCRPPTPRGRPTTTTAGTASTAARSTARPATRWRTRPPTRSRTTGPFDGSLASDGGFSYLWYAEYQMIRFLEENGYNVSYTSQADLDQNPALLQNHKLFLSSGHDEYWSAGERSAVESARDAGVNLAFFSGNEIFWKTRWTNSSRQLEHALPHAGLVQGDALRQPPSTRRIPPPGRVPGSIRASARRRTAVGPQNALTGQFFMVNSGTLRHQGASGLRPAALLARHPGRRSHRAPRR